jgi:type I restriction enzyme, S subunit
MGYRLILSDKTFRPIFRRSVNLEFMVAAMNSRYYRDQVEQAISGAEGLANNLPLSSLRSFLFVIPPPEEAVGIVAYLKDATSDLDRAISKADREIALLSEYRTRLVSDVVTGKLDVRPAAAALPETEEEPVDFDATVAAGDEDDLDNAADVDFEETV